jgi:hypothetical protein
MVISRSMATENSKKERGQKKVSDMSGRREGKTYFIGR